MVTQGPLYAHLRKEMLKKLELSGLPDKHIFNALMSANTKEIATEFSRFVRPGSVDSLNGGSTDAMKKVPVEK